MSTSRVVVVAAVVLVVLVVSSVTLHCLVFFLLFRVADLLCIEGWCDYLDLTGLFYSTATALRVQISWEVLQMKLLVLEY